MVRRFVDGDRRVLLNFAESRVSAGWNRRTGAQSAGERAESPCVGIRILDHWKGLKLRAEIEVKGMRYPVRWACHQKLNDNGSLTLRPNLRQQV